jgi:hypothetical protein
MHIVYITPLSKCPNNRTFSEKYRRKRRSNRLQGCLLSRLIILLPFLIDRSTWIGYQKIYILFFRKCSIVWTFWQWSNIHNIHSMSVKLICIFIHYKTCQNMRLLFIIFKIIVFFIIMLFTWLHARIVILLTCGRHINDRIISLRG